MRRRSARGKSTALHKEHSSARCACVLRHPSATWRYDQKAMAAMRAAGALAVLSSAHSNLYDVIQPHLIPPEGGCVEWASLPDQDKHWFGGKPPADAGAHCAQQGKGNPGGANWDPDMGSGSDGWTSYGLRSSARGKRRCDWVAALHQLISISIPCAAAIH